MTPELKPCPFCGGEAAFNSHKTTNKEIIKLNKRDVGYGVNCVGCAANNIGIILGYKTEEEAAQAWNRRAPAEPVKVPSDAEIDQLAYEHCDETDASGEEPRFTSQKSILEFARALLTKHSKVQS